MWLVACLILLFEQVPTGWATPSRSRKKSPPNLLVAWRQLLLIEVLRAGWATPSSSRHLSGSRWRSQAPLHDSATRLPSMTPVAVGTNRCFNYMPKRVPVKIQYAQGEATRFVDQSTNGGRWNDLGMFDFDAR